MRFTRIFCRLRLPTLLPRLLANFPVTLSFFEEFKCVLKEFLLTPRVGNGDTVGFEGINNPINLLLVLGLPLQPLLRISNVQNLLVFIFVFQVFFVRLAAAALIFYTFFFPPLPLPLLRKVLSLPLLDLPRQLFEFGVGGGLLSDLFCGVLTVPLIISSLGTELINTMILDRLGEGGLPNHA